MEEYLARQPVHIAAQKAREFKQSVATLYRQWDQTETEFCTTILPTPPVSFCTQFRTPMEGLALLTLVKALDEDQLELNWQKMNFKDNKV